MARPRILVVDDEPDILMGLRDLFEGTLGCQVVVTTMPHVALMALGTKPGFDLVVADYKMPGMDGVSFLERARQKHPKTPSIFMTAFPDAAVKADALGRGGATLFLPKPLDPDQLLDAVRRLLGPDATKPPASPTPAERKPGRIPTFGPSRMQAAEREEELHIATCSACRAQVVVDPGEFAHDRSGWIPRPCFVTPACIGMLQP